MKKNCGAAAGRHWPNNRPWPTRLPCDEPRSSTDTPKASPQEGPANPGPGEETLNPFGLFRGRLAHILRAGRNQRRNHG